VNDLLTNICYGIHTEFMREIFSTIKKEGLAKATVAIYFLLTVWWVFIYFGKTTDAPVNHIFGFVYGGFSLFGAAIGLISVKYWGGWKSIMGKATLALSLGLFAQGFGQYSFWFYNYALKIPIPYPGIPDIGFASTIAFYVFAGLLLASASGAKVSLRYLINKIQLVIIPLLMIGVSYFLFLKGSGLDWTNPLKTILDYGYPLGDAAYISIAILTYSLSKKLLGGLMKSRVLLLLLAFVAQYAADFVFIYFSDQYFPASFIDFFYMTSYFVMALGLIHLKTSVDKLRSKPE